MELLTRLKTALVDKKPVALPQFTSCSPGWIKYMEHFYPESCRTFPPASPRSRCSAPWPRPTGRRRSARSPRTSSSCRSCRARRRNSRPQRPEMNSSGVRDVDAVLTTRELGRMIKQAGIDFRRLPDGEMDRSSAPRRARPISSPTRAASWKRRCGPSTRSSPAASCPSTNLHVAPIAGLTGVKEASVKIDGHRAGLVVPRRRDGEGCRCPRAGQRADADRSGSRPASSYHFVEVMTCPGGCIGGGGQPRLTTRRSAPGAHRGDLQGRRGQAIRKSHDNPEVKQIYGEFLRSRWGRNRTTSCIRSTPRERV